MSPWTIFCDEPSLVVEFTRRASALGLAWRPQPSNADEARAARERDEAIAWLSLEVPSTEHLALFATPRATAPVVLCTPGADRRALVRASALGFVALDEVAPFVSTLRALELGLHPPFQFSDRALEAVDRQRLSRHLDARRGAEAMVPADAGTIALLRGEGVHPLGEARDVAAALDALRRVAPDPRPAMPRVEGVDPRAVLDIILGPPRELSDPASKAALAAYDVPLPLEEVCASPSRAASEAASGSQVASRSRRPTSASGITLIWRPKGSRTQHAPATCSASS